MVRRRNNIVLVRRDSPKKVTLPSGRTFYAKYRRVTRQYLPGGTAIARTYKGRPVQGRPIRAQARAKPANAVRPSAKATANALLNIARSRKARSRSGKAGSKTVTTAVVSSSMLGPSGIRTRSRVAKGAAWRKSLRSGQKGSGINDIARSIANSPFAQDIGRKLISKGIKSIPSLFRRSSKEIKNKHLRNIFQSEIMSDIINQGTNKLHGGIGL